MRAKPNVVVIVVDCLSASHLGCYDYDQKTSPFLDSFAAQSAKYEFCLSVAPWTLPSIASILTGKYSEAHELTDHLQVINPEWPLISEILARQGYRTAAFVENKNLQEYFGYDRGFEIYHNEFLHVVEEDPTADTIQIKGLAEQKHTGHSVDHSHIYDLAGEFLQRAQMHPNPYFLFFHTNLVHDFYLDYPYYRNPDSPGCFPEGVHHNTIKSDPFWRNLSTQELASLKQRYDQGIRFADQKLRQLIEAIDLDNTIVVIMSDHGESFHPELKRFHHCGRLHNDILHVPLIIHFPDREKLNGQGEIVSTIDVVPTILDFLSLPSQNFDGRSLLKKFEPRELFALEKAYLYFWKYREHLPKAWFRNEADNLKRGRITYKSAIPFQVRAKISDDRKTIVTQVGNRVFVENFDLETDFAEENGLEFGPIIAGPKKSLSAQPLLVQGNHLGKTIYVGMDYSAAEIEKELLEYLEMSFGTVIFVNQKYNVPANYVLTAEKLSALVTDDCCVGILICGSGIGMSIVANKSVGVYAARCTSEIVAKRSRRINNSNVLCLSSKLGLEKIKAIILAWINTTYEGRKMENLAKIIEVEDSF
ncbi:sulfatase-like hydrolase/transferase [Candidatus Kuenenbacteria bacterium]|nr:sulfatase-like hydrolase/transferase [Candidatus Kuenenbacteria bacterium]